MEKSVLETKKEMPLLEAEKQKLLQEMNKIENELEVSLERRKLLEAEIMKLKEEQPQTSTTFGAATAVGNDTVNFIRNVGSPPTPIDSPDNNSVFNDSEASSNISLSKFPYPSSTASNTPAKKKLNDSGTKSKFDLPETIKRTLAKGSKDKMKATPTFQGHKFFVNGPPPSTGLNNTGDKSRDGSVQSFQL